MDLIKELSKLVTTQNNFIITKFFPERLDALQGSLEGINTAFDQIEKRTNGYIGQQAKWQQTIRSLFRGRPFKPSKEELYQFKDKIKASIEVINTNIDKLENIKKELKQPALSSGIKLTQLTELCNSTTIRVTIAKNNEKAVLETQNKIIDAFCPHPTRAQETEMEGLRTTLNGMLKTITKINLSLDTKAKLLTSNTLTPDDIRRIQGELTATDTRLQSIDLQTASSTVNGLKYTLNRKLSSLDALIKEVDDSRRQTRNMLEQIQDKARRYTNIIPLDLNTTPATTQDWTLPVDNRSGWITGNITHLDYRNQINFTTNLGRNDNPKCFPNASYPAYFARYAIYEPVGYQQRNPPGFLDTDRTSLYDICEWVNETDKEVVVFHGTHLKKIREFFGGRQTNNNLNTIATNHDHVLGQGFYVTFNPNEALGYVRNRPPSSIQIPAGQYVPAIYEIVLTRAHFYLRGSDESRHPEGHPQQGLINDQNEHFQFIQNNKRPKAKEQITIINEANHGFRTTINTDKMYVHTYRNGTTVDGGPHDQSNDYWGPSFGNQNIPYLRDRGNPQQWRKTKYPT